jgi:Raf kinase inhibitor-like YbhB/YbcL family protein
MSARNRVKRVVPWFLWVICLSFVASGCGPSPTPTPAPETPAPTSTPPAAPQEEEGQEMPFELTSTAFAQEEPVPAKYSCDSDNVSPPLQWSDPPNDTQSFALIMDDPDAPVGTWIHWVLYDLPADARDLPEAIPADADLSDGSRHGENSWRRTDYGGPCPPSGTHRYFFKLYALDTMLGLDIGATKTQLLQAMEGHILTETELMGTYSKQ